MKHHRYILPLLIILLLFVGCKKYEENPFLSLRGSIGGYWNIVEYKVNDSDSLKVFSDNLGDLLYFYVDKPGSGVGNNLLDISGSSGFINQSVVWDVTDDKKNIIINVNYSEIESVHTSLYPFITIGEYNWKIMKLTRKEFNIESTINGLDYRMELEKTE